MTTTAARLDLRLNTRDKDRIALAAALRGVPVSAFVRDAVLREAEAALAADMTITLSPEESHRLIAALDKPFTPSAKLKQAMERGLTLAVRTAETDAPPAFGVRPRGTEPLANRLRGRATARMGTDEIMQLTRGA
ncbi:MAG: DUF1778 domain-containing protein [Xanthomonadales bacterium]|nr:DUF1778 domain-containing protein [Xanthomonadales bacterium]